VAILLSVAVGGAVILIMQPVPDGSGAAASLWRGWLGKVDLLWFSYATLFGPAIPTFRPFIDFAGPWQSLQLATPLIFTGLGLAFGFRTGLFNIGASGQIIMGGIFAAAVGIYIPGPWWLISPLAVVAAALGGGLWGALPGWLKARFGSSEVINTIMLNYIASSLLIFLLGSTQAQFFGRTVALPFKAPGLEPKSHELLAGAQFPTLISLFGLKSGDNLVSLGPIVALVVLAVMLLRRRGSLRARLVPALAAAAVALAVGWFIRFTLPISNNMVSVRLSFSFILALMAAAFYAVFMWRTRYGYELRAVGLSPRAAEYGGVNIRKNIVLAMAISGALCGLAATHYVLGGALEEYRLKQVMPADTAGFGGITVALLGQNTPWGVIAAATLFGVLGTGGLPLTQALNTISRDIVVVLQALIVVFIATRGFLSSRVTSPPAPGADASTPPLGAHGEVPGPQLVSEDPLPGRGAKGGVKP
ncbi:MAG TPA: ABC transporter permease, partial [Deinococcales bacterium]|nr:ABC transporter permease [Deinococcales bacterium]